MPGVALLDVILGKRGMVGACGLIIHFMVKKSCCDIVMESSK